MERNGFERRQALPKKHVLSTLAPKPVGPYSQGVIAGGLFFISGQIPVDPVTGKLVGQNIEEQTERALKNLMAILRETKMGADNVVKTTVYLADIADFEGMNEVYDRYLGKKPPARSTVQVSSLPKGALIEIDAIATF